MANTDSTGVSFALDASPSHLLHKAQQLAATQSAEALKVAGITLRQFSVLVAVSAEDGISQSRIVDMTGVDRSTLADMIARMETAGLVRRKDSREDKRAKSVALSAKGRRILTKAIPAVSQADEAILNALPKNRRSGFLSVLSTLSELPGGEILPVIVEEPVSAPKPKPAKIAAKPKASKKAKPKAAKTKKIKASKAVKPKKKPAKPKKKSVKKKTGKKKK